MPKPPSAMSSRGASPGRKTQNASERSERQSREETEGEAERREKRLRDEHRPRRFPRLGRRGAPGQGDEGDAERSHETGGCERRGEREHRPREREIQPNHAGSRREAEEQRLKRQPLAWKAVEKGKPRDRKGADEKEDSRPRHPAQQAPEALDLPRSRRHRHAPRAEKQQTLEDRMVQDVQEARGQRPRRRARHSGGRGPSSKRPIPER